MKDFEKFSKDHPWLMGESNVKRAFAIWGYSLMATILVWIGIFAVSFVLGIVLGIAGSF